MSQPAQPAAPVEAVQPLLSGRSPVALALVVSIGGAALGVGISYGVASTQLSNTRELASDASAQAILAGREAAAARSEQQLLSLQLRTLGEQNAELRAARQAADVATQQHAARLATVEADLRGLREGVAELKANGREVLEELRRPSVRRYPP